jgi:hypothetical protein
MTAEMKKTLEDMKEVPIDILPIYRKDFEWMHFAFNSRFISVFSQLTTIYINREK